MTRKLIMLIIFTVSIAQFATAQYTRAAEEDVPEKKGFDPQRLFFGGNFGLTFGNFTFINVSPVVGYRITNMFSAGTQVNFIYQSNKINYTTGYTKSEYAYVGLGVFGRFNPVKFLLLNVQPEMNYIWGNYKEVYQAGNTIEYKQKGKFIPSVLLGAGAAIPTGGRGALIAMIQYDIVQNELSPYGRNPFFSFGFNF